MNLDTDPRYSTYSISIIYYLLHHNETYNNEWKLHYPENQEQLKNFFKNVDCGCWPVLLQTYRRNRFQIDLMTVNFINSINDFDVTEFINSQGRQDLRGTMFSIKDNISEYKDFLANVQAKNADFDYFNTLRVEDKIIINFF